MEITTNTHPVKKYEMEMFQIQYGTGTTNIPTATVSIKRPDEQIVQTACTGNGSVEALYKAIAAIIIEDTKLLDYQISSIGGGKDALAVSTYPIDVNGETFNGRGTASDVLEASANAYINAVNRYLIKKSTEEE